MVYKPLHESGVPVPTQHKGIRPSLAPKSILPCKNERLFRAPRCASRQLMPKTGPPRGHARSYSKGLSFCTIAMSNLVELNPIDVLGDDDEPVVDFQATDPTSWDANNLLGRYHVWKIASKFPIPGSAVLNDFKRRQLGPTADELEIQASKMRKEFETREEVMRCVLAALHAAQVAQGRYGSGAACCSRAVTCTRRWL